MKYFAYGSNMLVERLIERKIISVKNPTLHALHSYKLRFHKKSTDCSGKCSIVKTNSEADVVHGVIFDIDDKQIGLLDKAEGVGYGYRRDDASLKVGDSPVSFYIAENGYTDEALVPYRWYYDLVLAGAEQHNLPLDYVAGLKAIPFTEDPKSDRDSRREALAILGKYTASKKAANSS